MQQNKNPEGGPIPTTSQLSGLRAPPTEIFANILIVFISNIIYYYYIYLCESILLNAQFESIRNSLLFELMTSLVYLFYYNRSQVRLKVKPRVYVFYKNSIYFFRISRMKLLIFLIINLNLKYNKTGAECCLENLMAFLFPLRCYKVSENLSVKRVEFSLSAIFIPFDVAYMRNSQPNVVVVL